MNGAILRKVFGRIHVPVAFRLWEGTEVRLSGDQALTEAALVAQRGVDRRVGAGGAELLLNAANTYSGTTTIPGDVVTSDPGRAMNTAVAFYVAHWIGFEPSIAQMIAATAVGAVMSYGAVSLPGEVSFISSIAPIASSLEMPRYSYGAYERPARFAKRSIVSTTMPAITASMFLIIDVG